MPDKPSIPNYRKTDVNVKAITDAPGLRAANVRACWGCEFFKRIEGDTNDGGTCSQYEFYTGASMVCDDWVEMPMRPLEVVVVEDTSKAIAANPLKAISKTADELRVGNYMVLFGGRDLTGIGHHDAKSRAMGKDEPALLEKNPDGSTGNFFSPATTFESEYTKAGKVLVDWEHGFRKDGIGPGRDDILGYVDVKSMRVDERGVFVERVLNRRAKYMEWIEPLIEAGLVGNSVECVHGKGMQRANGEIIEWPLMRDTFTVEPYEPRQMTENVVTAIKALGLSKLLETQPAGGASQETGQPVAGAANADTAQASTNQTEENMAGIEELTASVNTVGESVKGIAGTVGAMDARMTRVEEALKREPAGGNGGVQVVLDEADRPYKSFGAQLQDVVKAALNPHDVPKKLLALNDKYVKAMKATGASEGIATDGGYLVQQDFSSELFKIAHDESLLAGLVRTTPMSDPSNRLLMNAVAETSRVTGSRWGGLQAYWLNEGGTKTASKPTFRQIEWNLRKLTGLFYATDELLRDARALAAVAKEGFGEEFGWMLDDAIYNGTGGNKPLGFMNSGAVVSVAKESGQAAATVLFQNIVKMWVRLPVRSRKSAVWLINQDVEAALPFMVLSVGTGGVPVYLPASGAASDGLATLMGRPVIPVEQAATLGTTGDIVLFDPQAYMLVTKDGIQEAESMHVAFVTDETVFRFVMRVDGQPLWNSALTPANGSNTMSPYVTLATRA